MDKEIITTDCPKGIEGCLGLATHNLGSGIEIEITRSGYIARADEKEFFGNCTSYQECFIQYAKNTGPSRRSAIVNSSNPCSEIYIGEPGPVDPEVFRGINETAAKSIILRNLFDRYRGNR